jgi:Mn-dependent DtxR family transcriptional regulator
VVEWTRGRGREVVKERYLQAVIDLVRSKGCVTRRYVVERLQQHLQLTPESVEKAADRALRSLVERKVVARKGRGVYCWLDG